MMLFRMLIPLLLLYGEKKNPVDGRTRMQKFVFLAQQQKLGEIYKFIPFNYGPYSKELQNDVDDLITRRLIRQLEQDVGDGKKRYVYRITPEGEQLLASILASPEWKERTQAIFAALEDVKRQYHGATLERILHDIYTNYPEYASAKV